MELASYLAGERWGDHPACTHPLLGFVARLVNDHTSDEGSFRLAEVIPSVIGLTGDDLHIDALITLRCATIALPVTAGADRQRVLGLDSGLWEGAGTTRWTPKAQPLYRYSARASRSAPSGAMGRALHEQRSSLATSLPPAGRTAWCPVRNRGCRTRAIHRVTSARCQLRP
jgi:hypothetical protein